MSMCAMATLISIVHHDSAPYDMLLATNEVSAKFYVAICSKLHTVPTSLQENFFVHLVKKKTPEREVIRHVSGDLGSFDEVS